MAIPVRLDSSNEEEKYYKKSSTPYRSRTQSLLLILLLPAAATVTTDVWFQSATLSPAFGYDLVLAITNVTGAFFDGFFSDWESGSAVPSGAVTEALHLIAGDMRTFYFDTYTSWAGMVGVAAAMAHARSSAMVGIMYILLSILCAFVAHGLGSDFAQYISSPNLLTNKPYMARAQKLLQQFMMGLAGYILLSYLCLGGENLEDSDEERNQFLVAATPRNQLVVSAIFAILGAYVGHLLVDIISKSLRHHPLVQMDTLVCNALFGLLGLSLNAFKLSDVSWGDSLILRGFAINFCGAASLFARHIADNRRLYKKRWKGLPVNITANILFASLVFWAAFEIEEWAQPSDKRRGVVVKLMKILEKRRSHYEEPAPILSPDLASDEE
eukprot:CAMPEP_0183716394 /NCGR_PEP_ID=MMETSP0737-20130205/10336_1 /TAXON_ID=385413 /ORGANISM="Thalassiosira miniscula, Strain CCMP1093" /LENGTH=383 /DNA_ID=CAMNT_0025945663 /DNA_START=111 /DNA_END=1262 /DNA_ORIENTATION=+